MLFNSYAFLFVFLPASLLGYFALATRGRRVAAAWLAGCSLFFYGYWDYRYVPLLLASIAWNFAIGSRLSRHAGTAPGRRWLALGVGVNLSLLVYYKYADFFISVANSVGASWPLLDVVLPIGISFFTFTQIAFLVDAYRGKAKDYDPVNYALFVTYFPHLIAGPILHHKEMMPQFERARSYRPQLGNFAIGLTIFALGLAKKVLIADNLAPHAAPVFTPDREETVTFFVAWSGALAYTFQLYFDFSGYSDMAIGLARLFGVQLPLNFASPYKAASIGEFWRRWHMTLSRFLRDYLYIPLGGNRRGSLRRYVNLLVTMVLGGLWHGAGWPFVVWGALHGVYLVIHQAWRRLVEATGLRAFPGSRALAVALTFMAVVVAWVFFRAPDVDTALAVLGGMAGVNGLELPDAVMARLTFLQPGFTAIGIRPYSGGGAQFQSAWMWIAAGALVAFAFPNTQQIVRYAAPRAEWMWRPRLRSQSQWRPNPAWAVLVGVLLALSILRLSAPTEFLYFQF